MVRFPTRLNRKRGDVSPYTFSDTKVHIVVILFLPLHPINFETQTTRTRRIYKTGSGTPGGSWKESNSSNRNFWFYGFREGRSPRKISTSLLTRRYHYRDEHIYTHKHTLSTHLQHYKIDFGSIHHFPSRTRTFVLPWSVQIRVIIGLNRPRSLPSSHLYTLSSHSSVVSTESSVLSPLPSSQLWSLPFVQRLRTTSRIEETQDQRKKYFTSIPWTEYFSSTSNLIYHVHLSEKVLLIIYLKRLITRIKTFPIFLSTIDVSFVTLSRETTLRSSLTTF